MTGPATPLLDADLMTTLAEGFVSFLETGHAAPGLFTPDVFCDFTPPQWRLQAAGLEQVVEFRNRLHPPPGRVPRWRCDPTPTGFVIEFEERWTAAGQDWYCREMVRADVRHGSISAISVYCTGDWDEATQERHRRHVALIRP